jgi:hypothetical protein
LLRLSAAQDVPIAVAAVTANAAVGEESGNAVYVDGVYLPDLAQAVNTFNFIVAGDYFQSKDNLILGYKIGGSYNLPNASTEYRPHEKFGIEIRARNITDTEYAVAYTGSVTKSL